MIRGGKKWLFTCGTAFQSVFRDACFGEWLRFYCKWLFLIYILRIGNLKLV